MTWTAFLWRNLRRNKPRSLLTGAAIALAIALVCFLATMPDGLDRMLDALAANTRIVVHDEAGLVYPLPYAYVQKMRAMSGVAGVASWSWFGGMVREGEGISFPNFAIEPDAVGTVWPDWDIDPAVLAEFARRRDGAIVGRLTMRRYGWEPGER